MNIVLGTKFKMILGYGSSTDIDLAMERGEVVARGGFSLSGIKQERPDWIRDKKINALFQVGSEREKDYPEVPLMHELAETPGQRQVLTLLSSPNCPWQALLCAARGSGRAPGRFARCIHGHHE